MKKEENEIFVEDSFHLPFGFSLIYYNIFFSGVQTMKKIKTGIIGGTSLLAGLLIDILYKHPYVEMVYIDSEHHPDEPLYKFHKFLKTDIKTRKFDKYSKDFIQKNLELVFITKPHKESMRYVKEIFNQKIRIIDLSGDFRLKNVKAYEKWYNTTHIIPQLVEKSVYGLSEIYTEKIKNAILIANPGCYPTGILLSLYPLVKHRVIQFDNISIVSYSGVSGAGRNPVPGKNLFIDAFNNIIAYKVTNHQHIPEIEEYLEDFAKQPIKINFVPHITSIENGIFNTIFVKPQKNVSENEILGFYEESYKNCKFIRINQNRIPEIKDVVDTNFCDISLKYDNRTDTIIVFSAIDNRIKGGVGQAVQNMNIMCGFPEETGLI